MKILVLMPHLVDTSPGARFRIEQWARHLGARGFSFDYVSFEDEELNRTIYQEKRYARKVWLLGRAVLRRFASLGMVKDYDLVFLQREAAVIGPAVIERLLARSGVPVVYDFDDAIWTPYLSPANKYFSYLKFFGKTATNCRLAAHVTVGNTYLAEYARRYNPDVTVVPTTIDTDAYGVAPDRPDGGGPATVGWTGSYSTVQHLDTLRGVLAGLRRQTPFRLLAVGTSHYELDGVQTEAIPWRAETEVEDLRRIDVGIMPLPDNDYARGKCGLKMLQYMALGIPSIASPVGVNTEIIRDGVNGFLASTEGEWVEKLSLLIHDRDLRRRIGLAGRQTVEERFSARAWAPRVGDLFEAVAARGRRRPAPAARGAEPALGRPSP